MTYLGARCAGVRPARGTVLVGRGLLPWVVAGAIGGWLLAMRVWEAVSR